jgi:hypothetical protein
MQKRVMIRIKCAKQRDAASFPQKYAEKTKSKASVEPPREVTPPLEVKTEDEDVAAVPAQESLTEEAIKEQHLRHLFGTIKSMKDLTNPFMTLPNPFMTPPIRLRPYQIKVWAGPKRERWCSTVPNIRHGPYRNRFSDRTKLGTPTLTVPNVTSLGNTGGGFGEVKAVLVWSLTAPKTNMTQFFKKILVWERSRCFGNGPHQNHHTKTAHTT